MTILHDHRCDGCGVIDEMHPDDGPPQGWFLVARMVADGAWSGSEWHLCGYTCLRRWAAKGGHAHAHIWNNGEPCACGLPFGYKDGAA